MDDLFVGEMNDREEIERLSGIIEDMRRTGIKLRNELSDFVDAAKFDNESNTVFPGAQEAISEWNNIVKQSGLEWKEDILTVPGEATLKFLA